MSRNSSEIMLKVDKEDLRELIKRIMNGTWRLYLPQFQRDFTWNTDDVLYFLDSIRRNLPVGSIILWKPKRKIEEDPFAIPLIDIELKASMESYYESYYVLDGQQRLTSLLLLYNGWKISREEREYEIDPISYVPAKGELERGTRRGVDLSVLYRAYLDGRMESVVKNYPSYKNEIEEIVRRIVNYEIPIYIITTTSEDSRVLAQMGDAFIRINRAGVRIGLVELMLSFIAGMISGRFSREIRELHDKLKLYDLKLNVLIRFVLSNFGVSQTVFSDAKRFRSSVEGIKFDEETLYRSKKSINVTIDFLQSEFGLNTCQVIPSQVALIPIATYFYEKDVDSINDLNESERRQIANWFMLVNMKGYYSTSTNSKLQRDVEIIRKRNGFFPYNDLVNELGERQKITKTDIEKGNSVNVLRRQGLQYIFLLYVLLVKEKAEDLDGKMLNSIPFSEIEKHHIFPRRILEKSDIAPDDPDEKESFISGLGNITLISKSAHRKLPQNKTPDKYLPSFPPFQKHFIPKSTELWKLEKYDEFRYARIMEIYGSAKKHFTEIVK